MKNLSKILQQFRDPKFRRVFILVVLLVLLVVGGFYYLSHQNRVFIDDSLIQAPIITISPQAPGILNETDVSIDQYVSVGDQLAIVGTQVLRANTDGLIVDANKEIGSSIAPQTSVIQMVNSNDFRVVGTIDENKGLNEIKTGQVVSFSVDAYPGKTYWGYVDEVSPTSKQTALTFSISSERPIQQFSVFARFDPQKYPEIKNGMSAKMIVYTQLP